MQSRGVDMEEIKVTKPVIASALSADEQIRAMDLRKRPKTLVDGDGDTWQVDLIWEELTDENSPLTIINALSVAISVEAVANQFVESGVLDLKDDARILAIFGERRIVLETILFRFSHKLESELETLAFEALSKIKRSFGEKSLVGMKRQLIFSLLDDDGRFGEAEVEPLVATF